MEIDQRLSIGMIVTMAATMVVVVLILNSVIVTMS